MLLGILAGIVGYSLTAGTLPEAAALVLALGLTLLFAFGKQHSHGGMHMDAHARRSRFAPWNGGLKVGGSCGLLLLCVLSPSGTGPVALGLTLAVLTAGLGGLGWRRYLTLLRLPAAFLLLSALTLLWDLAPAAEGVLALPFLGRYLVLTAAAQASARLILARAFGAVSCLYFLSLSTPLPELLSVLRWMKLPEVMLDLMALIYRYIFLLLSAYDEMKNAAASRLGYGGLRRSLQTTGRVYGNLLGGGFRRSRACFDAMESRCFTGGIGFLTEEKPVTARQAAVFSALMLGVGVLEWMGWSMGV